MNQLPYWPIASLLLVPVVLYLGLRAYLVLLARFDHERRNVKQISELHLATIEALARAIDAKDGPRKTISAAFRSTPPPLRVSWG